MVRQWLTRRGYRFALAGSAGVAAFGLLASAPIIRILSFWPPSFGSRPGLAAPLADDPWGSPWDALTRPPSTFQAEALGGLASAIGHLALGCLLIAGFSLALHAIGRMIAQWRGLTIRCALGARLGDLARLVGGDLLPATLAGSAIGLFAGGIAVGLEMLWWPALLDRPAVAGPIALAAAAGIVGPIVVVGLVTAPLLVYLERRVRAVADQAGERATQSGGLLFAQNLLAILQLAGLLVVAYGGALLVRGSSLLDADRPVPYGDSSAIAPLDMNGAAAASPSARAAAYTRLLDAGRRGDTPLVAIASPGAWLGFGKRTSLIAFCPICTGDLTGILQPINGATSRVAAVSPGALGLMGIRIAYGRDIAPADSLGAQRVIVLSEALTAELFPRVRNPVGLTVHASILGGSDFRVIGLAQSPAPPGLGAGGMALPFAYFSILQLPPRRAEVVARSGAHSILERARWLSTPLPNGLVANAGAGRPLIAQLRESDAPLGWFGALALALAAAALGVALAALVVVMGQTVEARRKEIGVRIALGAQRHHIWRWVGVRSLALTIAGAGAGAGAARWVGMVLRAHVRGFETDDIALLLGMMLAFGGLALLAALLPARRAMRVEPAKAWSEIS